AKRIAREIFTIIGKSESKVHDIPLEKIHFHEVSGVDSILDIVGTALLLDKLQVTRTYSSPVCTGYGMVKTQHGLLPVPAPATEDILQNLLTFRGDEEGERTTPTGAAILKYLKPDFNIPVAKSLKSAYGPGEKDFIGPNVVRLSLIDIPETNKEKYYVIETNIDDSSGEMLGATFQEELLQQGARDFTIQPVQMKKGRQGVILSVLATAEILEKLSDFILENTTTIGLRYCPVERKELERRTFEMNSVHGKFRVKETITPKGVKRLKIEYESLLSLSRELGISIQELQMKLYNHLNLNQ
ncbi:MAG: LarC family nickel insertion protein, partial [Cyclobacteriaceae bacterium]|nr:LarC family nickel insertion protein [Cyclobacteriaceae bacterium]